MTAHVLRHAVELAAIDPPEVEDVVAGCGLPEGATGQNIRAMARSRRASETQPTGASTSPLSFSKDGRKEAIGAGPFDVAFGVEGDVPPPRRSSHCRRHGVVLSPHDRR